MKHVSFCQESLWNIENSLIYPTYSLIVLILYVASLEGLGMSIIFIRNWRK